MEFVNYFKLELEKKSEISKFEMKLSPFPFSYLVFYLAL